jgi:apolipoprotein N-acyltransferase
MPELICAALSAAMFYFSQGTDNVWALTWLAPAPLLWLAFGDRPTWRLAAAGFIAFLAGQVYLLQCYPGAPPMAYASLLGLRPILFPLAILFARLVHTRLPAIAALLAFPACWTAMEWAAAALSQHGSFGSIAYSEMSAPVVLQSASLFGMYSVTFVLCLFASSLALAARGGRHAFATASLGLALCAIDLAFGAERLLAPQPQTVRVAALADMGLVTPAHRAATHTMAADMATASAYASTIKDLARRGARLIVTPEESLTTRRAWRAQVLAPLALAAKQTGAEIVAGVLARAPWGDTAVAFEPDGRASVYAKRHLLMPIEFRFAPGAAPGLLGGGRAMAICKDMDFPGTIRQDARNGLRMMAVPAWDFGADGWIHGRMAVMRGVENGFAIVRAASLGLLSASDAEGRLIAEKPVDPDHMDWILADLPPGPGPTLYTRIGDVFSWACLALTLLLGIVALSKPRRRDGSANAQHIM